MKKIVINNCHGGFGLSNEGVEHYAKLSDLELVKEEAPQGWGRTTYYLPDSSIFMEWDIARDDPMLVQTVQALGDKACDHLSDLKIVEIPDDVKWQIDEYDGLEWVAEQHRTWGYHD